FTKLRQGGEIVLSSVINTDRVGRAAKKVTAVSHTAAPWRLGCRIFKAATCWIQFRKIFDADVCQRPTCGIFWPKSGKLLFAPPARRALHALCRKASSAASVFASK